MLEANMKFESDENGQWTWMPHVCGRYTADDLLLVAKKLQALNALSDRPIHDGEERNDT